jgi:hypothetical protein
MCDKLVFDLSQEVEGSPNVFVRKDWINILDNQNQNYSNNQSIIDTSQLSNSNKYMSYRESYLAMPLLLTITQPSSGTNITSYVAGTTTTAGGALVYSAFNAAGTSGDYCLGLKNWFGTMIHSMTLDYNGSTICQQTPYINMWNSFKLMTSLSYQDLITQGSKLGFYPDDPTSFQFFPTGAGSAQNVSSTAADYLMDGTCNNSNYFNTTPVSGAYNNFNSGYGNIGLLERQQNINFDCDALVSNGLTLATGLTTSNYTSLLYGGTGALTNLWKSYILTKISGAATVSAGAAGVAPTYSAITVPVLQINVMATVMLKHIHSFFNMCPLLKGVFMKITLNLNNTSTSLVSCMSSTTAAVTGAPTQAGLHISAVNNAVGGVNPLMIASPATLNGSVALQTVSGTGSVFAVANGTTNFNYVANISVGATCLDNSIKNTNGVTTGNLAKSIYLYVPAYTFNPTFEQAYLSTPVKQINYTDVYQYQITNVSPNGMINNLVTNGIANIKSILVLPYYSSLAGTGVTNLKSGLSINNNTNILQGLPVYQSPFDPAGTGPTSPLCHLTNFNVQISGQNAIYNLQKYVWEEFNNQLYGQNAVNGGLTDGLTSGLVGRQEFDMSYCYYYVNVERMLPVEQSVPKSVQIIGQNLSNKYCDYWVFVEYGVSISIDVLTGARV